MIKPRNPAKLPQAGGILRAICFRPIHLALMHQRFRILTKILYKPYQRIYFFEKISEKHNLRISRQNTAVNLTPPEETSYSNNFSTSFKWIGKLELPIIHDPELSEKAFKYRKTDDIGPKSFRQLAFLGDSLIYLHFTLILRERFPLLTIKNLALVRSKLIRRRQLAQFSRRIGLADRLYGPSDASPGLLRHSDDVQGEAMEAYIGAVYVDSGEKKVFAFCNNLVDLFIEEYEEKIKQASGKTKNSIPAALLQDIEEEGKAELKTF